MKKSNVLKKYEGTYLFTDDCNFEEITTQSGAYVRLENGDVYNIKHLKPRQGDPDNWELTEDAHVEKFR